MNLQSALLDHWQSWEISGSVFHATLRARGLYSTFQFVLRLSPEVHRQLEKLPTGVYGGYLDFEAKQAFSTYLHETIHWWQHVGSSYGLMLSLTYPAQTQANYSQLKRLMAEIGFKKPLRRFVELSEGPSSVGTTLGIANIIVNNHFDIETFRTLSVWPKRAATIVASPLFECIGHAYHITIANNVLLLGESADPKFQVLQHPRHWLRQGQSRQGGRLLLPLAADTLADRCLRDI